MHSGQLVAYVEERVGIEVISVLTSKVDEDIIPNSGDVVLMSFVKIYTSL